jgi:hypothetical protein
LLRKDCARRRHSRCVVEAFYQFSTQFPLLCALLVSRCLWCCALPPLVCVCGFCPFQNLSENNNHSGLLLVLFRFGLLLSCFQIDKLHPGFPEQHRLHCEPILSGLMYVLALSESRAAALNFGFGAEIL